MKDVTKLTEIVIDRDGFNRVLPIFTLEEYINYHDHINYCEILILSDGRIVEARPSHMYSLAGVTKALTGKKLEDLDASYYEEDMRYFSQSVTVYYNSQFCFSEESFTNEQLRTVNELHNHKILIKNIQFYKKDFIEHYKMMTGKDCSK